MSKAPEPPPASRRVDLHTHSVHSDGTSAPEETVRRAHARGVEVLALTDHDTVGGCAAAAREARRLGLPFVHGIEINTGEGDMVHVLGYGLDPACPALARRLSEFRGRRVERLKRIVERISAAGVELRWEEIEGAETLGRPHIADALRRKGVVRSRREAFQRFLSRGGAAYVESMGPSVREAVEVIRAAGGWASLAHPGAFKDGDLKGWVDQGLEGIEAFYPAHTAAQRGRFLELAARYGLVPTGGSDYHGPGTGREEIGGIRVPEDLFERLRARLTIAA